MCVCGVCVRVCVCVVCVYIISVCVGGIFLFTGPNPLTQLLHGQP